MWSGRVRHLSPTFFFGGVPHPFFFESIQTMQLPRPFVAACAACAARAVTFPIDTMRVRSMVSNTTNLDNLYKGVNLDLLGSGASTFAYFSVYESGIVSPLLVRAAAASVVSGLVYTWFDVHKKRVQSETRRGRLTATLLLTAYGLNLCKRLPKTCIHYVLYEELFCTLRPRIGNAMAGGASAAMATMVSVMTAFPIDLVRMRVITGRVALRFRRAILLSICYSVIGSAIGHTLLEYFAPRSFA